MARTTPAVQMQHPTRPSVLSVTGIFFVRLTRLTESGLSIVEWNLIKGMKPPANEAEWNVEFEKYKQFPEYKLLNHNITLNEFKFIFFMEWGHRMLGRFIGLAFIIPGIYFAARGYMSPAMRMRSLVVATLIGGQSLTLQTPQQLTVAMKQAKFSAFKRNTHFVAMFIFLTALSGAFVAGLDAGLIYNEFPFMGEGIIPSDMWALSEKSASITETKPLWRNFFENAATVQFNHRVLAMTTATAIVALWVSSRRLTLPPRARLAVNSILGVMMLQVSLGITTLIYFVPVPLAAAHQSGSLLLLSNAIWLMQTLRRIPK
ncbi:Cytochrome c oxidase assembly protein cox15 [Blyttiomyces sp. JEL0837]|nr:Cytochrome c oxidase assembly protein cox15 [Blyttiomyces sp. JEL0837]